MIDPKHNGVNLRHIIRIYYFLYSSDSSDLDDPIYDVDSGGTFDIIELFISELDKVAKKGLPVEYREGRENLQYLRGNINVVQTMMNKQLGRRDIFDCSFDELSRDITINQVLYLSLIHIFVLSMINKKIVQKKDFLKKENGAVLMKDDARKRFLTEWQNRKKEMLTHPYLQEKIEWGMVPYVQAMLLARYLRGDLDAYPPFLWK